MQMDFLIGGAVGFILSFFLVEFLHHAYVSAELIEVRDALLKLRVEQRRLRRGLSAFIRRNNDEEETQAVEPTMTNSSLEEFWPSLDYVSQESDMFGAQNGNKVE
jgi:hypothetical protein